MSSTTSVTTGPPVPTFHLYTYFRSSCSARLRIALNLKSLPYTSTPINLLKNSQNDPTYTSLNPSHSVPTLIITYPPSTSSATPQTITITQSLAALEYLDEAFPTTHPLLPPASNPAARATVRTLCSIVACDIQPPTNLRILSRVRALCPADSAAQTSAQYARELMADGLRAYEAVCQSTAGKFSFGDEVTMADCCLVPAVWGALRWGVDLGSGEFETVRGVMERLGRVEAVRRAHWKVQADTPEELRGEPEG